MNCKEVFKIIDNERRINYKNRSEMSEKIGFTNPQGYHIFMKRLEANKNGSHFNKVCKILEKLGYEIVIKKKEE